MRCEAIGDGAIGAAGQRMLTTDFGRTRLAETSSVDGEARTAPAGRDGAEAARRDRAAVATKP